MERERLIELVRSAIGEYCSTIDQEYSCSQDKDECRNCLKEKFNLTEEEQKYLEI